MTDIRYLSPFSMTLSEFDEVGVMVLLRPSCCVVMTEDYQNTKRVCVCSTIMMHIRNR